MSFLFPRYGMKSKVLLIQLLKQLKLVTYKDARESYEDFKVGYDYSVRGSTGSIIQFIYVEMMNGWNKYRITTFIYNKTILMKIT